MYKNGERMMAWVAKIAEIQDIPNSDSIEAYRVGGWWVVDKKGAYSVGDYCVYVSIDSWIPHDLAPFLSKGQEPREYNGIKGERLRTVKLRGQVSQGLLLPHSVFGETAINFFNQSNRWAIGVVDEADYAEFIFEGDDVTDRLGIQKYEPPIPAELGGDVVGAFPSYIPKTDQERIQNLTSELEEWKTENLTWEVTEKLDGSSMTVFMRDGYFGVCSRNWELRETESNSLWRVARRYDLENLLKVKGNYALQGELIGEGIQGNPYKIKGQEFYIFDIYDIDKQRYLSSLERIEFVFNSGFENLRHVPLIDRGMSLKDVYAQDLLKMAEDKSIVGSNPEREGIVFKCNEKELSFKAISNRFLIKKGE